MKRFFTRYGLPVMLAAIGSQAMAEEPIFNFTFDTAEDFAAAVTVKNKNEDNVTWKWNSYTMNGHEYYYAQCYDWSPESYNDWMLTKEAYSLKKGTAYKLSFQGWTDSGLFTTTLKAGYAPASDPDDFTELFSIIPEFPNKFQGEIPAQFDVDFEVPADGDYHIVFISEGNAKGGGSCVDNVMLVNNGSPMSPAAVSNVTASGDPTFALKATVSFTLPVKTVTGSDLPADGISKVEIYRGDVLAATLTDGLTPGATLSWTDANAQAGENTYRIICYNGDLKGAETDAKVYVGPLTPFSPTNVAAVKAEGGKIQITWSAPTESVEGISLDENRILYNVSRIVNGGDPVSVAKNIAATEYEDEFTSEEMAEVVYSVETVYGPNTSEGVQTEVLKIGSYPLPFEESFANAVVPDDWEFTTTDSSYSYPKKWNVLEKTSSSPYAKPFDKDGGLLGYNSFSSSRGNRAEAITPEIKIKDASNPILEFRFYHSTSSSSNNDQTIVKVSKDGGEFVALEDGTLSRYDGTEGWKEYQLSLADFSDAKTIRVAFEAVSSYGADMAIDAIRIYSGKTYDLQALSLEAEPEANTGASAEFLFTVKNLAATAVSGADYKVNVYAEGALQETIDGKDVASKATAEFEFAVPVHAGHVETGMPVYAEIDYAADEDIENNVSSEIVIDVKPYTLGQKVQKVNGTIEDETLRLSWADVEVDQYDKVESVITLDRDEDIISVEDYKADNSIAWPAKFIASDGGEWQNIDKDGIASAATYSFPTAVKPFMFDSREHRSNDAHYDYSHELSHGMLVAVAPGVDKGVASDYLVSPMLPGKGNHKLEFVAKSYSSATPAEFIVEYTTESEFTAADIESKFVALADKVSIPYDNNRESGIWKEYVYELPADAKYVAIHFVGKSVKTYDYWGDAEDRISILCVDNLKLTSEQSAKPVYNVYYREYADQKNEDARAGVTVTNSPKRHNEAELETAEYVVSVPTVATDFHVSCVYPEGETALSEPFSFNFTTGVESVEVASKVSVKVEGRHIAAFAEGNEQPVSVYSVDGKVIASDAFGITVDAAGAYIVKAGDRTLKVIIR